MTCGASALAKRSTTTESCVRAEKQGRGVRTMVSYFATVQWFFCWNASSRRVLMQGMSLILATPRLCRRLDCIAVVATARTPAAGAVAIATEMPRLVTTLTAYASGLTRSDSVLWPHFTHKFKGYGLESALHNRYYLQLQPKRPEIAPRWLSEARIRDHQLRPPGFRSFTGKTSLSEKPKHEARLLELIRCLG